LAPMSPIVALSLVVAAAMGALHSRASQNAPVCWMAGVPLRSYLDPAFLPPSVGTHALLACILVSGLHQEPFLPPPAKFSAAALAVAFVCAAQRVRSGAVRHGKPAPTRLCERIRERAGRVPSVCLCCGQDEAGPGPDACGGEEGGRRRRKRRHSVRRLEKGVELARRVVLHRLAPRRVPGLWAEAGDARKRRATRV
jgi:hypothetical protein